MREVWARRRGGRSKSSLFVFIRGSSGTVLVGGAFGGRRGGDQGIIVTVLRPIETPRVADISYISVYSYLGTATAPRLVAAMASRVASSSVLGLVGGVYICLLVSLPTASSAIFLNFGRDSPTVLLRHCCEGRGC